MRRYLKIIFNVYYPQISADIADIRLNFSHVGEMTFENLPSANINGYPRKFLNIRIGICGYLQNNSHKSYYPRISANISNRFPADMNEYPGKILADIKTF